MKNVFFINCPILSQSQIYFTNLQRDKYLVYVFLRARNLDTMTIVLRTYCTFSNNCSMSYTNGTKKYVCYWSEELISFQDHFNILWCCIDTLMADFANRKKISINCQTTNPKCSHQKKFFDTCYPFGYWIIIVYDQSWVILGEELKTIDVSIFNKCQIFKLLHI